ncbi:uncharacterized protein LOC127740581 [Arachis duranensis]|uniref:Uncharacterized protein LOC127740581 n=1 Tax=Arachis duranensis TaxID=130453 RepID=A0A9C6TBU9_ARADU|nr:uncharacterized protein LOC127740581 [Arachis duranensis]
MSKVFKELIGKSVEVYIDDILVKTVKPSNLVADLEVVFGSLRKRNMRLNPLKCMFAMEAGKFLGLMITQQGVEAKPDKWKAILRMTSPGCMKDVQRLASRFTILSHFLRASTAKALPLFNLMKKGITFEWTPSCDETFNHFKRILSKPSVLGKPKEGETLYLYIAVTEVAMAAVLIQEEDKLQQLVYFISKVLQGAEMRKGIGKEARESGILLALYDDGCPRIREEVLEMPGECEFLQGPNRRAESMLASRPFSQWGVNLLGQFLVAPRQVKNLIVAIDYYTKWVEAEPLASILTTNCQKFFWRQVIAMFEIPEIVVSNNGTHFFDRKFGEFLTGLGFKQKTTPQCSTEETPFRLTYGVDAGDGHLSKVVLKQRIALRYNRKVLNRNFEEGDLVLRRNDIDPPTPRGGKLAAN